MVLLPDLPSISIQELKLSSGESTCGRRLNLYNLSVYTTVFSHKPNECLRMLQGLSEAAYATYISELWAKAYGAELY
jgi:hypothetical protein